jgi:hypothetical protein
MKKLTFILIACLVMGFVFWKWFFNQPCTPPDKPKNVPTLAVWSGGCDGGDWIELVDIKEDKYRFRIYQDWNGELKMDAYFEFKDNKTELTLANWGNKICCYSQSVDSRVTLSVIDEIKNENKHCYLISIYPAFGGSDWDIIKEKFK